MSADAAAKDIDAYIAAHPPAVRAILQRIRRTVREAVPEATEVISYRMPAFKLRGILLYFAAFNAHIGVFPPVSGDARLEKALAPYEGPKRNLRFPYDAPMRYDLIRRIVTLRARQQRTKAGRARSRRP